jgi:hypothetical protein
MDVGDNDILRMSDEDLDLLKEILEYPELRLLEILRDLRQERLLEYQIYSTREQWMWIPWTSAFAAAIAGLLSPFVEIRVAVVLVTGLFAAYISQRRRVGLTTSFNALNMRHQWVVHISRSGNFPSLKVLGFDPRLLVERDGTPHDILHVRGFKFPLDARILTAYVWIPLLAAASYRLFVK